LKKPMKQSLALNYAMKKKSKKKMAHGGSVDSGHQSASNPHVDGGSISEDSSGYLLLPVNRVKRNAAAMSEDDKDLNQHGEDEVGPEGAYAQGGQITDNEQDDSHELDMVGRIMKKRQMEYSEGGMVANGDSGLSTNDLDEITDSDSNEMDDLALRDDLESSYDAENSGDEIGNEQEDEDREDTVAQIMKSRKKKASLPISGYGRSDKQ